MKHTLNRTLAVFLAVIMVFGGTPLGALAGIDFSLPKWLTSPFSFNASAANYSGTCGANLTWSLDTSTGVLTISGTGEMDNYLSSGSPPWFSYRDTVKSITFGNGVTSIGDYAFGWCSLTSVTIPDSVTSIGNEAFSNCTVLTSVTIGNSVTSIGGFAFYGCTKLTGVTIPDGVTSIGDYAFYRCTGLTSITIPDNVTSIGDYAFYRCDNLTSITVDDANQYYSSDSYGVLFNKDKTTLIQYPIGNARTSYEILDGVTSIGISAFDNCHNLTSVTIPNSVTSIGDWAFYHCNSLTSVTIPNSVTSIGDSAFEYCTGLTSVSIPDSVTNIGDNAFFCCTGLTSVTIGNGVTSMGESAFGSCDNLTSVTIGNGVTSIGASTFCFCHNLTSVTIGNGVTSIEDGAFFCCTGLTSVTIPDSVTSIGQSAFSNCTVLTSVTIGNSVMSIGDSAFGSCDNLTSVTIPNSVTSIGNYAFAGCRGLTSVTIGNSVTSIGREAFSNCTGLTNVIIPNSVTSIGHETFWGCESLTSITVDDTNQYYSSDSYGVLYNKDKTALLQYPIGNARTSYEIPDSVTSIGDCAFCLCSSLTSITIPDSVMIIGSYAFYRCASLTSVTIGNSVTSIGKYAFGQCTGLTDVYYSGTEIQWSAISIGYDNEPLTSATIHYNFSVPVTGVSLSAESLSLTAGDTSQLTATVTPSNATDKSVTWTSSNTNIATVDANGLITAKAAGTATITVTANDTTNGTIIDTCEVTVTAPTLTKIEIKTLPAKTSYFVGDTLNTAGLTLTATYNNNTTQTITSGFVCSPTTLNTAGTQTITVTYEGKCCTFDVTVNPVVVNTYTINFNANGGTGAPESQTKAENVSLTLSATVPTKSYTITYDANSGIVSPSSKSVSCTFNSWNSAQNGSGTSYAPGASYTVNANATLYAQWTNPVAGTLSTPTKTGWTFVGWFVSAVSETPFTAATVVSSDITLFARWQANSYTINFYDGNTPLGSITLVYGQTGTLSYGSVPQKTGYDFVGWSTTDGGPALFADGQSVKNLTAENNGSVSYYAVWNVQANTNVVKDDETGVEIVYPDGAYDGEAQLSVEKVLSGTAFDIVENNDGVINPSVFCIKTTVNGSEVQPNGAVQVKIPIPEDFDTANCKLYYINTATSMVEEIAFTVENGYIVFTTTHFSYWAIAEYAPQVRSVSLSAETLDMRYKSEATLTVSIDADEGAQYTTSWSSSNPKVIKVDQNGKLTAVGAGTATVTVTTDGGKTASCMVTVKLVWWQWLIKILLFGWIWY